MAIAACVAVLPQHALQCLERGVLAVLVDPALQGFGDDLVAADASGFGGDGIQPAAHVRIIAVFANEARKFAPRVREQHVLDEGDAAGRALDVRQDRRRHLSPLAQARNAETGARCRCR